MLNVNPNAVFHAKEQQEYGISIASTLACWFLKQGIGVRIVSNGKDVITGGEIETNSGMGMLHMETIDRKLSRIDTGKTKSSFVELLQKNVEKGENQNYYIIINAENSTEFMGYYEQLKEKNIQMQCIVPTVAGEGWDVPADMITWEVCVHG